MRTLLVFMIIFSLWSCQEEKILPDTSKDPFGAAGNGGTNQPTPEPDPLSIQGLHKNIFSVRCANPTCHDGSFEPDFRTVQSTWATLVYHKVIKNDTSFNYTYRVVPGNPDKSWLMERLLTEDPVLGRMPLYAQPLDDTHMQQIRRWIENGAKDADGNPALFPNLEPEVLYFRAYGQNGTRLDSIKTGGYNSPFIIPRGNFVEMRFGLSDDKTPSQQLSYNKVRFSYQKDDFSQPITELNASWFQGNLFRGYFQDSIFDAGKPVYFRYYVQDADMIGPKEFPTNGTVWYAKEVYSFIIQ